MTLKTRKLDTARAFGIPDAAEVMLDVATTSQIDGVRVEYNPYQVNPAEAFGLIRNKRIVVGPAWLKLDQRTQRAILLHELKHITARHNEKRVLFGVALVAPALLLPWPVIAALGAFGLIYLLVRKAAARHELDADAFVAAQGHGPELLAWIKKVGPLDMPYYPNYETRCRELEAAIREANK